AATTSTGRAADRAGFESGPGRDRPARPAARARPRSARREINRRHRLGRFGRVEVRVLLEPEHACRDVRRESTPQRVVLLEALIVASSFLREAVLGAG